LACRDQATPSERDLRVDDSDLNHGEMIKHQSVGHGSVNPSVVGIVTHAHLGEETWGFRHLIGAARGIEHESEHTSLDVGHGQDLHVVD